MGILSLLLFLLLLGVLGYVIPRLLPLTHELAMLIRIVLLILALVVLVRAFGLDVAVPQLGRR